MSLTAKLKDEFFGGWTKFEALWLCFFLTIQLVIFAIQPDGWIATIAAITGILCVVFVGKGKISNYLFGLISVSLYAYTSYTFGLYGEMQLNLLVYVPVQFIGFYLWRKHMTNKNTVNSDGLEGVIANAEKIKGKAGQSLRDHLDDVLRNRRLNRLLTDLDLGLTMSDLRVVGADRAALARVFEALEFRTLHQRSLRVLSFADGAPGQATAQDDASELTRLTELAITVLGHDLEPARRGTAR